MPDPFEQTWRADLAFGTVGVQLAEVEHPLEVYVGSSDLGAPRIQVRSSARPNVPNLADVIVIHRAESNGAWVLTLTLQDRRFVEAFIRLAVHVVDRTRPQISESAALAVMDSVFDEWRRMMTPSPRGRLGIDTLRGLIGELWFLLHRAATQRAFGDAVAGWTGPLGTPQDFWFPESGFSEVKSIGQGAKVLRISSAEQLDEQDLELIVLTAPQVSEGTPSSVNLVQLHETARMRLSEVGLASDELDLRMRRMGVDLDDHYYAETFFEVQSLARYPVTDGFPAIRASDLPAGVGNVQYQLALSALEPFQDSVDSFVGEGTSL